MRCEIFINIVKEYQAIDETPGLGPIPFTSSDGPIGNISANATGQYPKTFDVYAMTETNHIYYGAVLRDEGDPSKPKAIVGFEQMSSGNALVARNAWTDPNYQKRGLGSSLILFANQLDGTRGRQPILSDTQLTPAGIRLWKSLIGDHRFKASIYNAETGHIHEISEIDGVNVLDPATDNAQPDFWDGQSGQRFFYLLEQHKQALVEGQWHNFGFDRGKHYPARKLLFPPSYFGGME